MSSIYPASIDGYAQIPLAVDTITPINAETVNRLRSAIINIETELGVLPSSENFVDVRARLDALEADITSLQNVSGSGGSVTQVTSDISLDSSFQTVLVDASSGEVTITLPEASSDDYFIFNIKKIDSSENAVIISPVSPATLDGESQFFIDLQYDSLSVVNYESNWFNI